MKKPDKLIFMVDDDKVILNLLEYVFQGKDGYTIKTFPSGEECLNNMDMNPDLVVLDYILNISDNKALNGLETLRKIREIHPDTPVIILSGKTDNETGEEMIKNGAVKVLSKDDFFVDRLEKYMACIIG